MPSTAPPPALPLANALGHDVADKRLDILRRIGQAGSISEAARGAGVSYKAAWQAIDTLTNLAGAPLVERTVGGSGGGGALLTATGRQLLEAADTLQTLRTQALEQVARGGGSAAPQLAGLGLRTSMRNQLPCQVQRLVRAGRATRVLLTLADGGMLAARITRESAELLGLQAGSPVLALAKAMGVAVHAAPVEAGTGTNQLAGTVARVARAASGDEVVIRLPGGLQMVGFAAPGLHLRMGEPAVALVDESAVVLATTG